jgi:hypothetical protein
MMRRFLRGRGFRVTRHLGTDPTVVALAHLQIMVKLTFPDRDNFHAHFVADPRVLKVRALSDGYRRVEADERLTRKHGVIASFSTSDQGNDQGFLRARPGGERRSASTCRRVREVESLRP